MNREDENKEIFALFDNFNLLTSGQIDLLAFLKYPRHLVVQYILYKEKLNTEIEKLQEQQNHE